MENKKSEINGLPWIEKYRPETLDNVIDHEIKIKTLKAMIANKELTHVLFYGPPGTGKTSTILAMAKDMYGNDYRNHILELNASDDRGIEVVRKIIPDFCKKYIKNEHGIKLVILDEVDAMTNEAQHALRRVMEIYSKTTRFCLICNNINYIIPGLKSRCAEMKFNKVNSESSKQCIKNIIEKENIKIEPEALTYILNINGDFRKLLNDLQCFHSVNESVITIKDINNYLGLPCEDKINEFIDIIKNNKLSDACDKIIDVYKKNEWNLSYMLDKLLNYVINSNYDDNKKIKIINRLSDVQFKIGLGYDSEIHLCTLICAFYN
jgi:replication factor C subunit 3/5